MNIKTKSFSTKSASRRNSRRASLAAAIFAGSMLVIVHPVFAWTNGSGAYSPDREFAANDAPPSFDESWQDLPSLSPAPMQPLNSEAGSVYVAPAPAGLIETPGYPATDPLIDPIRPETIAPGSVGQSPAIPGAFR